MESSTVTRLAHGLGTGLLAGAAGTVAMTLSSTIEQRLRGRAPSTAPAAAASRVLGIEKFQSDAYEERFSTMVHWGYGTAWGAVRGVLGGLGLAPLTAGAAHFAVMWGSEQVLLPALDVAPPITMWGRREVTIDTWHHLVHVVATGIALELIARRG